MIWKAKANGATEPFKVMHGGMTELEEAELTDRQGRALSGHRALARPARHSQAYAHALASVQSTAIQNAPRAGVPNEGGSDDAAIA